MACSFRVRVDRSCNRLGRRAALGSLLQFRRGRAPIRMGFVLASSSGFGAAGGATQQGSLEIAADLCIYTNRSIVIETLG